MGATYGRSVVVTDEAAAAERIAELEGQVEALEHFLELRSRELRAIIEHVDPDTLRVISRVLSGLPVASGVAEPLDEWPESTELQPAEVPETMIGLWRSTASAEVPDRAND